ncbi:hypothetical protein [Acinetobacter sp.]|uniref:hypothetical protein n=1 Tax=Acinetobacter sp. TaxID=472 RepID=UPI000C0A9B41|nr:hypothetical protein [Acinetobacter sp.]MAK30304.1 hypothetical protein [Acinetobacter sp.]
MAERIEVGVVVKGADKASQEIDGVDKATKELGTGVGAVSSALDKMTGGAVTAFRKAANGTKAFIKGLKLTKVALISTGIGAIVVAVGALVGFFLKTNKGAKMLKVGLAALGAVVERVTGYFQAAGSFIVGLFSGGVTKAVSNYNEEINKLSGSLSDAVKQVMELERRTQDLKTSQRDLTVQFAEGRAQIKEYNMIAEDTTRGLEERLEAAEKAIAIEKELMAERQRIAQEEFDIATQRAQFGDSTEEDLDNLAQLEVNLINIRTESAEMQTTLNNKVNSIRAEAMRKAQAEADAIKAAEKEKQEAILETQRLMREEEEKRGEELRTYLMTQEEIELEAFQEKAQRLLIAELEAIANGEEIKGNLREQLDAEKLAIEQKFEDQRQAIIDQADAEAQAKKDKQDAIDQARTDKKIAREKAAAQAIKTANLQLVDVGFQALQAMAKTEEGQRKLALAQILVNQGIALSNAVAGAQASALATGPGAVFTAPGFTATLVGIVLSSFAQIKGLMNQAGAATEGLDTTAPNLSGGGGGTGGGGGGPQLALTPDLAQSFNEAMGSQAVQAYVVQQDLADANALQQSLADQASLGGG